LTKKKMDGEKGLIGSGCTKNEGRSPPNDSGTKGTHSHREKQNRRGNVVSLAARKTKRK